MEDITYDMFNFMKVRNRTQHDPSNNRQKIQSRGRVRGMKNSLHCYRTLVDMNPMPRKHYIYVQCIHNRPLSFIGKYIFVG